MAEIVVAGELLAEFVAARRGQGFAEPGEFTGPFPSGAPAIFADQAARLGASVAYAGCVGRDAFGDAIVARLASHGVRTDAIRRVARPTGLAFVAYRDDGSRQFVYSIDGSASALLEAADVTAAMFEGCRYYHVMGSSLTSENAIAAVKRGVIEAARWARGSPSTRTCAPRCWPSSRCAPRSRNCSTPATCSCPARPTCRSSAARSRPSARSRACWPPGRCSSRVVLKRGAAGSSAFDRQGQIDVGGYETTEIDPTGAGDCFGGTLVASLIQGWPIEAALSRANAAGALAVARVGPMEGNSSPAEIVAFLTERGIACPA